MTDFRRVQRRLNEVRALCEQSEKLRASAERLLRELTLQIERTRKILNRPAVERRKKPR